MGVENERTKTIQNRVEIQELRKQGQKPLPVKCNEKYHFRATELRKAYPPQE